ncbi:hypothetical protein MY5147_009250 [Beauveria neobassiana]
MGSSLRSIPSNDEMIETVAKTRREPGLYSRQCSQKTVSTVGIAANSVAQGDKTDIPVIAAKAVKKPAIDMVAAGGQPCIVKRIVNLRKISS